MDQTTKLYQALTKGPIKAEIYSLLNLKEIFITLPSTSKDMRNLVNPVSRKCPNLKQICSQNLDIENFSEN